MKIVNIIYSGLGGHAAVVFALIEGDKSSKNTHIILFYGIEEVPSAYIEKCYALAISYNKILKKPGLDLVSNTKVLAVLESIIPDVIILHSINLILPIYYFTKKHKIKLISVEHQPNHLKMKIEWIYSILIMFLSNKVVYLTKVYESQMAKALSKFYIKKKVSVINNGTNLNLYKPGKKEESDLIKIGMLSRLMPTKDHSTLIYAFNDLLKNYKQKIRIQLNIAGDGSIFKNLQDQVNALGIQNEVNFLGMIPENGSIDFLQQQDIYVHASLGETMSTSIIQAMACEKAIIASDVEGINNMLKNDETAILVPPKNKEKLMEAFALMIESKILRETLSKNAFIYAHQNFSNEAMYEKYFALFN